MEKGVINDERCFCLLCHKDIASPMYSCCNEFCLRKVYVHKSCAQFPQVMLHPFHPRSLTLLIRPPNEFEYFHCDACWRTARTYSNYHCFKCDFNHDICCASLVPAKIPVQQKNQSQIQHHILHHPHPLIVCDTNNDMILFNFTCSFCKLPINGSRIYVCLDCKCLLDESYADWPSQIQHPFHRQHPLTLFYQRWNTFSRQCRACGKVAKKGFGTCGKCRVRDDQWEDSSKCSACGKWLREGFSFNCSECNFSLDPLCASLIPLPSSTQNSQGSSRDDEFRFNS